MKVTGTPLPGVWIIEPDLHEDDRGTFSTHFSAVRFGDLGLRTSFRQSCISTNRSVGTLRGLHWQSAPNAEVKLIRCVRGAIFDVALDLRRDSPTFRRWHAVELSADNHRALYIPEGCAHGYQTLEQDSCVAYEISADYVAADARGVRWNDPMFDIDWPAVATRRISGRDAGYADFDEGVL
jgi:dTDP-4-dehydrorhamnose 3,5-epimerase